MASEYKLVANINFKIYYKEKEFDLSIEENWTQNSSNSFELRNYEQIIKNNFAESLKKTYFKITNYWMIIKSSETNKIDINKNLFILFYGNNHGYKEQAID